jgi:hypothetical protein
VGGAQSDDRIEHNLCAFIGATNRTEDVLAAIVRQKVQRFEGKNYASWFGHSTYERDKEGAAEGAWVVSQEL